MTKAYARFPRFALACALIAFVLSCGRTAPKPSTVATSSPPAVALVSSSPPAAALAPVSNAWKAEWTRSGLYAISEDGVTRVDPADGRVLARAPGRYAVADAEAVVVDVGKEKRFLHPLSLATIATFSGSMDVEGFRVNGSRFYEGYAVIPEKSKDLHVIYQGAVHVLHLGEDESFAMLDIAQPCATCAPIAVLAVSGDQTRLVDLASGRQIAALPVSINPPGFEGTLWTVQGGALHFLQVFKPSQPPKRAEYRRYNVQTGAVEASIPLPCELAGDPTPSPDGTQLLVRCGVDDALLLDLKKNKVRKKFKNFVPPCDSAPSLGVSWEPSGARIHKEGCNEEAIFEMPSGRLVCADTEALAGPRQVGPAAPPLTACQPPEPPGTAFAASPMYVRGLTTRVLWEDGSRYQTLVTSSGARVVLEKDERVSAYDPTGEFLVSVEGIGTDPSDDSTFQGKLHVRRATTGARLW